MIRANLWQPGRSPTPPLRAAAPVARFDPGDRAFQRFLVASVIFHLVLIAVVRTLPTARATSAPVHLAPAEPVTIDLALHTSLAPKKPAAALPTPQPPPPVPVAAVSPPKPKPVAEPEPTDDGLLAMLGDAMPVRGVAAPASAPPVVRHASATGYVPTIPSARARPASSPWGAESQQLDLATHGVSHPTAALARQSEVELQAASPSDLQVRGTGNLAASLIFDTVAGETAALRYCYAQNMELHGAFGGKIEVEFTIEGDGSVGRCQLVDGQSAPPPFVQCLLEVVRDLRFPPPAGGRLTVRFPFLFAARSTT